MEYNVWAVSKQENKDMEANKMKKTMKIFGIGAVVLLLLMAFTSVVSAGHYHHPTKEDFERYEKFVEKAKGAWDGFVEGWHGFWDWFLTPAVPDDEPYVPDPDLYVPDCFSHREC